MAYQPITNPLPTTVTPDVGFVSTVNSTAAVLAAAGVFTGTSEDVTHFPYISIAVFADQASATDGLQIQQSSNGTNWDNVDSFTIPASSGKTFTFGRVGRYLRVVYTNGGTLQGAFRLQTLLTRTGSKDSSVRPQDARSNENDMTEALAFGMVFNNTTWDRLRGDTTAGLWAQIKAALPAGNALVGKFGIDQTTPGTTNAVSLGQIGANTVLTGNGITGTGSQRVTIASDQTAFAVNSTLSAETTKVIGTINVAVGQTVAVTQTTAANLNATVVQAALAKGTQGTTGVSTQDLKDAGRVSIMVTASVASTASSETLITITKSAGLAATTTGSSNTITTGKRFRIQGLFATARNTTGTNAGVATIRFRAAVAGVTSATSPLQITASVALPAAATSVTFPDIQIPDGFEIDSNGATNTWGLTILHPQWVTASVVATFDITLIGYEY